MYGRDNPALASSCPASQILSGEFLITETLGLWYFTEYIPESAENDFIQVSVSKNDGWTKLRSQWAEMPILKQLVIAIMVKQNVSSYWQQKVISCWQGTRQVTDSDQK